ncbi:hypothetical protein B7494_g3764 [Chlorociboria aeruginascens]|nr:hypothetical protein B7494_g3764 [Chlorociboria aeruginascens]
MPIRNPFAKRSDAYAGPQPAEDISPSSQDGVPPTFEKVDTMGSRSSAISISSKRSQDPVEYKMSVVNDSGVYLPPSPPESKGFWPRRSNPSLHTRNSESDIDPFPISRESFDSYRRSFDISARSPIMRGDNGRQSLDSARLSRLPRSAVGDRRFERQPPTAEEGFEEVGLNDEQAKQTRRKGFFSKFGEGHLTGRKRGQSGVGEELGNIRRPGTAGSSEVKDVR